MPTAEVEFTDAAGSWSVVQASAATIEEARKRSLVVDIHANDLTRIVDPERRGMAAARRIVQSGPATGAVEERVKGALAVVIRADDLARVVDARG